MKKPEFNLPGNPFNFDAIPLWLEPDLWDITKYVPLRRTKVAVLYGLSMAGFAAAAGAPFYLCIGIVNGFASPRALGVWIVCAACIGVISPPYGLLALRAYLIAKREADAEIPADACK